MLGNRQIILLTRFTLFYKRIEQPFKIIPNEMSKRSVFIPLFFNKSIMLIQWTRVKQIWNVLEWNVCIRIKNALLRLLIGNYKIINLNPHNRNSYLVKSTFEGLKFHSTNKSRHYEKGIYYGQAPNGHPADSHKFQPKNWPKNQFRRQEDEFGNL